MRLSVGYRLYESEEDQHHSSQADQIQVLAVSDQTDEVAHCNRDETHQIGDSRVF
jgi:hypothetical protein